MAGITIHGDKLIQFKQAYGSLTDKDLAKKFKISQADVGHLATRYNLAKSKVAFPGKPMPRWTDEEIEYLMDNYADCPSGAIATQLGRSTKSVINKAHQMQLSKTKARLSDMGKENQRGHNAYTQ